MLIVCPSCATSYDVGPASLPANGRQVRCLRCRMVWHAEPSLADKLVAAATALAADRAAAADAAGPIDEKATARPAGGTAALGESAWSDQSAAEPQPADGGLPADEAAAATGEDGPGEADKSAEVEAPPIAPVDLDQGQPPIDVEVDHAARPAEPVADIESVAARRRPRVTMRRMARWPLSRLQTAILALVLVDAIIVGWRSDIVRALPQTASFYALMGLPVNLRGLAFDGIVTSTEQHEGVPILVVEGNIVNGTRKIADVPRLKFVVRNAARQEIYSWTAVPARALLPPGEAVAFRTRLASPPPDAHDLILRFVTRRDILAATR